MRIKHRQTDDLNEDAIKTLENNQLLHIYGELANRGKRLINKAIRINQHGEAFTFQHFPEIRKNTYKQYIFHLRRCGLVEKILVSGCGFYRVKGFRLEPGWESITAKATGVSITNNEDIQAKQEKTYEFLQEYFDELEPPALHNIRLHFYADSLYFRLERAYEKNESSTIQYISANKSFMLIPQVSWEHNCSVKILVTSKNLVQIMIKNTLKPLAYDENGIYELISKLGDVRRYLTNYLHSVAPVTQWLFVRADFGRDCKKPLGRVFPEIQFRDLAGALIRVYAKSWPDGERRMRLEKIISPNKSIENLLQTVSNLKLAANIEEL